MHRSSVKYELIRGSARSEYRGHVELYGEGGDGNYPAGKYDLIFVTMLKDAGRAVVLGERIRYL